jgi:hypothetical protein
MASLTFNKSAMIALSVVGQRLLPIIGGAGRFGRCVAGFAVNRDDGPKSNVRTDYELRIYKTC